MESFNRYEYIVFSSSNTTETPQTYLKTDSRLIQLMLVTCEPETNVTVIPSKNVTGSGQFGPGLQSGGANWKNPVEGQTLLVGNRNYDLTGTRIKSSKPLVVISGHQLAWIPGNEPPNHYDHFAVQIPPHTTWGYTYLLPPVASMQSRDSYRFATNLNNTAVTITCLDSGSGVLTTDKFQLNEMQGLNWGEFKTHAGPCNNISTQYCSLQASNPVVVVQYAVKSCVDAPPFLNAIPPITQYSNNYILTEIDNTTDKYVSVSVHPKFFNPDRIILDYNPLALHRSAWQATYCSEGLQDICGYTFSTKLDHGNHIIKHTDENAAIYVHTYGHSTHKSHGFSSGMELQAIAGKYCPMVFCFEILQQNVTDNL